MLCPVPVSSDPCNAPGSVAGSELLPPPPRSPFELLILELQIFPKPQPGRSPHSSSLRASIPLTPCALTHLCVSPDSLLPFACSARPQVSSPDLGEAAGDSSDSSRVSLSTRNSQRYREDVAIERRATRTARAQPRSHRSPPDPSNTQIKVSVKNPTAEQQKQKQSCH